MGLYWFEWFFCAITALFFLRARPQCITIRLRAAGKKRLVLTQNFSPNKTAVKIMEQDHEERVLAKWLNNY